MRSPTIERLHEHRWFARLFREKLVEAGDRVRVAAESVAKPMLDHSRTRYRPRAEMLAATARAWAKTVPAEGQNRVGVTIALLQLDVRPGRASFHCIPCVGLQDHCLVRWHQRSFDQSENALMRDLGVLVRGVPGAIQEGLRRHEDTFVIPAGSGGWAGKLATSIHPETGEDITTVVVRTFLSDLGGAWRMKACA